MVTKSTTTKSQKSTGIAAKKNNSTHKVAEKKTVASEKTVSIVNAPVKEDTNPMKEVMKIKAHNEEVKAIKAAVKNTKTVKTISGSAGTDKGAKAVSSRVKNKIVKDTAQKTAAKKFAETKESENKKCYAKDGMWAAWARAYKNIFNFKGRTSRYEYWSFSLVNLLVLIFAASGLSVLMAVLYQKELSLAFSSVLTVFVLGCLALIFVYLSLSVRRIHDTGASAWKEYYRPMVYSIVGIFLVLAGVSFYGTEDFSLLAAPIAVQILISLLFIWALLVCIYYSTKLFIVVSFYEEDGNNEYGDVHFASATYKTKALKYTVLYFTVITLFNILAETYEVYYNTLLTHI